MSALMIGLILVGTPFLVFGVLARAGARPGRAARHISADYGVEMVSGTPMDAAMVDAVRKRQAACRRCPRSSAPRPGSKRATDTDITALDAGTGMDLLRAESSPSKCGPQGFATGLIVVDERRAKDEGPGRSRQLPRRRHLPRPSLARPRASPVGGIYKKKNLLLGDALMTTEALRPAPWTEAAGERDLRRGPRPDRAADARHPQEGPQATTRPSRSCPRTTTARNSAASSTCCSNLLYGLLGMAIVIAVIGIVNTLAMSVFETHPRGSACSARRSAWTAAGSAS
ncbi:hypothetical protein ACU686_05835 [Yinghuangia aomiensis]